MWLAFPTLFGFDQYDAIPKSFKPACHIFYGQRVIDSDDDLPKWLGHKNHHIVTSDDKNPIKYTVRQL